MNVNLIDYTGCGQKNPSDYAARHLVYIKNTRLTQGESGRNEVASWDDEKIYGVELPYIANTIRSSWEFVDYTFEIQGVTRAFTHQLVRTRTASYAQQAQRVVDMAGFATLLPEAVNDVDKGEAWGLLMKHIGDVYTFYQKRDVPNQDCRGVLPTNVLTNIIMKVNLRTLADLAGKRDNLRAQGEYTNVFREMARLAKKAHSWIGPFLYPERAETPALDKVLEGLLGSKSPIDLPELNDALKELDRLKGIWG